MTELRAVEAGREGFRRRLWCRVVPYVLAAGGSYHFVSPSTRDIASPALLEARTVPTDWVERAGKPIVISAARAIAHDRRSSDVADRRDLGFDG